MSLDHVLDRAFLEAGEMRREYARSTKRYKELVSTPPTSVHVTPHAMAEMTLLGERIADRAFVNLPASIRRQAYVWSTLDDDEQRRVLDDFVSTIDCDDWRKRRSHIPPYAKTDVALPPRYGSWTRGSVMPNCLGLSQMLIGWARATGAEHLFGTTIKTYTAQTLEDMYRRSQKMLDELASISHIATSRTQIKRIERDQRLNLSDMSSHYAEQAHHLLVIRGARRWFVLDPYMRAWYPLADGRMIARAYRKVHKDMNAGALLTDRKLPFDAFHLASLVQFNFVLFVIDERRQEKPLSNDPDIVKLATTMAYVMAKNLRQERYQDIPPEAYATAKSFQIALGNALTNMLIPPRYYKKFMAMTHEERESMLVHYDAMASRRSDFAKSCRERAIKQGVDSMLEWGYKAVTVRRNRPHPVIELAHPSYNLAVATVNYLAVAWKMDVPELVRYSSGQWIAHDAMGAIKRSGDTQLKDLVQGRLDKLAAESTYPSLSILRPLQPYLSKVDDPDGS